MGLRARNSASPRPRQGHCSRHLSELDRKYLHEATSMCQSLISHFVLPQWNFVVVMITPTLLDSLAWKGYLIFMCLNYSFIPLVVGLPSTLDEGKATADARSTFAIPRRPTLPSRRSIGYSTKVTWCAAAVGLQSMAGRKRKALSRIPASWRLGAHRVVREMETLQKREKMLGDEDML